MIDLEAFARDFGRHRRPEPTEAPATEPPPAPPAGPDEAAPTDAPNNPPDAPPPWIEAREERAAIMEFDGGLSRAEADAAAAELHPDPSATPDPAPEPVPAVVTCGTCQHFRRNIVNPAAGLGHCQIEAPASRRPPTLWPDGRHRCTDWQPDDERGPRRAVGRG